MAKKFKEDEMKWILSVEATGAQAEIKSFSSTIQRLKNENREYADSTRELTKGMKEQEKEMRQLAKSGDTTSAKYQQLKNKVEEAKYNIEQNTKAINTNNKSIDEQRHRIDTVVRSLKTEEMTMSQLKRRAADLKKQLDNTAKATSPEAYDKLEKELKDVDDRMKQLKGTSSSLNDTMKGGMQVFAGNMMTKAVEGLQKLASKVKDFIDDGIEMATTADGVKHAFDNLDSPGLLSNLQKATKNTVNDFELMKAAVQAKDFRIPLQDLGKYLQFAQLKAQQTGQSVEYMTNSIITGLGRKSVMILDNLGLSAAEINENVKKTGDFMSAVANIVDTQLATAADGYISRADRVQQKTVLLENAKLKLGQRVMWLQEKYDNMVSYLAKDTINTLSTANEKYEEQLDKVVKLETEMPDLLRQYEDLSSKSNLSTQEQDKLKIVIEQISSMVPGVITQWDNYGRAIAISTDKVYEFVESQKAMLAYMNQDAIKETENNIKEYKEELDKAQQEYNQGGKIRFEGGNTMFQPQKPVLHSSPEIMAEIEGDIAKYGQLLEGAELHLNDLQGKTLDKYVAETKERKKFTAMTKEELNKWIKDEKNAASEYMNIAKQVFNSRFAQVTPNSPTTTTTNKNSTSPKSKTKEKSAADIAKEEAKALLDAEKADITAIQKSREQDLRNLQNYYNKSVMALNQSLADRKITKQQHEMMMIELDKNLAENVLRVETEYYDHSRNLQLQNAELKIDLVEKTEQRVLDAEKQLMRHAWPNRKSWMT
ncbi:MAG: hypothetical protein LBV74_22865 [Tannerella sp.]|jgi:methyl-accepting chemotaxis protein|nr:hypothetical protein [Tannerella sp.]